MPFCGVSPSFFLFVSVCECVCEQVECLYASMSECPFSQKKFYIDFFRLFPCLGDVIDNSSEAEEMSYYYYEYQNYGYCCWCSYYY